MIPLNLRIQGLYSYQQEVDIDFERLTEGGLFGIFGPVGSGKSTMLEAITFALYGKSERLDKSGQTYNMMNLRSNTLLIDYTFSLGAEKYRFEVTGRRNSKNFEDVRTFKRTGYQWKKEQWVPLATSDGADLLGLSYENFTKTIIIPQGKFQDFLHLTPGARTQMLKELFELERFDLLRPTSDLLAKNKSELDELAGQMKELPELDPAEFRQQELELKAKEAEKGGLDGKLEVLRTSNTVMDVVKDLVGNLAKITEMLEVMEESEEDFNAKSAFLDRYEKADRHFREAFLKEQELKQAEEKAKQNVAEFQDKEAKISDEIVRAEEKFRATKAAYERREESMKKAVEMERMQQMQQLDGEIKLKQGRIDRGNESVKQKELVAREKKQAEAALEKEIEQLKTGTADVIVLSEVKEWLQSSKHQTELLKTAEVSVTAAETEMKDLQGKLEALQAADGGKDPEAALATQQTKLDQVQQTMDQIRLQSQLVEFAAALEDGAPCPLCGATDHPAAYDAGHADAHLADIAAQKTALEADLQRLRRLSLNLEQADKVLTRGQQQWKQQQTALAEAEKAQAAQAATFRWADHQGKDGAAIEKEIAQVRATEIALREKEKGLVEARATQQKAAADAQLYARKITELQQEQALFAGRHAALREQLEIFDYKNHQSKQPDELSAKEDFFREQYETITKNYKQEDRLLVQRKDAFQKLKTDIQLAQQDAVRFAEELMALQKVLQERLIAQEFPDLTTVKDILEEHVDLIAQRKEVDNYRQRLQKLRAEFTTCTKQLAGRTYDAEAHAGLQSELQVQSQALTDLNQAIGKLKNQMAHLQKAMAKRQELETRKNALKNRGENLGTLYYLFKGSGFVNYVSTMYLHELCQRANARFQKLTRNRLSLIVREDNTFQVRDMVNDGQVRSVKTLSGGQTFQASLSLALALADNIQHRNESHHNFFFLDEGFGTLDRESLTVVFDTLKQLRRENRIVGVISHVEEMQHEIDQCLNVWQDDEKGSFAKGSWE